MRVTAPVVEQHHRVKAIRGKPESPQARLPGLRLQGGKPENARLVAQ